MAAETSAKRTGSAVSILDNYQAFAVDLDGVVWRGGEMIGGSADALEAIRKAEKPMLLLTNNASYKPQKVAETLLKAGARIEPGQVLTSTLVAREWLSKNDLSGKPAFVLGVADVVSQLEDIIEVVPVQEGMTPAAVLVARYTDMTYDRLALAATAIMNGAAFVAFNNDPIMPVENGFVPGTGAIVSALQAASGEVPVVLGKPEKPMMEAAAARLGRQGVLMIGDRYEADVVGARVNGWDAALVLSGINASKSPMEPPPEFIAPSLADLLLSD